MPKRFKITVIMHRDEEINGSDRNSKIQMVGLITTGNDVGGENRQTEGQAVAPKR